MPALSRLAADVMHRWRRSLQLRVVTTTLVLSALVTGLVGLIVLHQIRDGLLQAKTHASLTQLDFGLQHAASQFNAMDRSKPNAVRDTASHVIGDLTGGGALSQSAYGVVLIPTDSSGDTEFILPPATGAPDQKAVVDSIPRELRTAVRRQREAWIYTPIPTGDGTQPGFVAGGPVPTSAAGYQLYYLFPLTQEQETLALVQRTMAVAGGAAVLLLVVITWLVTRQVVRPVRQAAATAERLAAGRLRDRMTVRGEDDLASLATSFNRMAETVEKQILQLRELSRVQRRFVADVSHELRTPITTIRMAADVLHDGRNRLPAELSRSAELLQAQLDRFEALLGDLLEISRHDAGAVALDADPVDLRILVERVIDDTRPLADDRGCVIRLQLPAQPVVVEMDARRIERILRNLVANAVEHGAAMPVDVQVAGGDGGVAVTVRDRGPGLRPGQASLVFGRFWRADPARARSSGGTGLGLSISLEDARLHGGWLQAWGQPGSGSVFRLTLPWRVGEEITDSPLSLEPPAELAPAAEVGATAADTTVVPPSRVDDPAAEVTGA